MIHGKRDSYKLIKKGGKEKRVCEKKDKRQEKKTFKEIIKRLKKELQRALLSLTKPHHGRRLYWITKLKAYK